VYIGLTTTKANEIWSLWTHRPTDGPRREVNNNDGDLQVTFLDFMIEQLTNGPTDATE